MFGGLFHAVSHKLIMITNDSYINARCVCQLLYQMTELDTGSLATLVYG